MRYIILLSFCFLLIQCYGLSIGPFEDECVSGTYPPTDRPKIPTYKIDLDADPVKRWQQVSKDKQQDIKNLITDFKDFIRIIGNESKAIINFIDTFGGFLANTFPAPFGEELQGIAQDTGIPLGDIVLYNVFYEFFTVCTSIVAHDAHGNMYHARNLDFGLFMGWNRTDHTWRVSEGLKKLIMNVEFYRSGKLEYKAVSYAGYVGVITAMRPGVFTMSMDERFVLEGGFIGIAKWLVGFRKEKWMSFLTREVMDLSTSYEDAKHTLSSVPLLAPGYYILGGNTTGQACVITRSRERAIDVWNMTSSDWYILETNYDHWKKPLIIDDRRTPAKKCMEKKGQQNMGFPAIFDVLSSRPVLNKLTTYTALMQVNSGAMESYLQYCPDPCIAW